MQLKTINNKAWCRKSCVPSAVHFEMTDTWRYHCVQVNSSHYKDLMYHLKLLNSTQTMLTKTLHALRKAPSCNIIPLATLCPMQLSLTYDIFHVRLQWYFPCLHFKVNGPEKFLRIRQSWVMCTKSSLHNLVSLWEQPVLCEVFWENEIVFFQRFPKIQ